MYFLGTIAKDEKKINWTFSLSHDCFFLWKLWLGSRVCLCTDCTQDLSHGAFKLFLVVVIVYDKIPSHSFIESTLRLGIVDTCQGISADFNTSGDDHFGSITSKIGRRYMWARFPPIARKLILNFLGFLESAAKCKRETNYLQWISILLFSLLLLLLPLVLWSTA